MRVSEKNFAKTILVVDDYADYLSMIAEIWKDDPEIKIATASNGFEALEYLKENNPPDLIITDLDMPLLDGFSFLRHLKSSSEWSTIAVMVLSSRVPSDQDRSALGETPYLHKGSMSLDIIEQMVEKLLSGYFPR